jgi:hypothetical protein
MNKIISVFLLTLICFSAWSQSKFSKTGNVRHNGGNGGDDEEIMIKNTLLQIAHFLKTESGIVLFKRDFNANDFVNTVKNVDIRVTEEELTDKFGFRRCALNFPEENFVIFNRQCVNETKNRASDFFVLITHEVLNLMGLELPDERGGSVYSISSKFGELSSVIQKQSKDIIINSSCELDVTLEIQDIELPDMGKRILKEKGYTKIHFNAVNSFKDENVKMKLSLLSVKKHSLIIDGNNVLFGDTSYRVNHNFMNGKFDGFLVGTLQGNSHYLTPVGLKTRTIKFVNQDPNSTFLWLRDRWWPNGKGKHFSLHLKSSYRAPFMETLLSLPTCVAI